MHRKAFDEFGEVAFEKHEDGVETSNKPCKTTIIVRGYRSLHWTNNKQRLNLAQQHDKDMSVVSPRAQ
jgi:hypothetical protein